MHQFERAMKAIQELHGRILHSYPPRVIVASLHPGTAGDLLGQGVIESVDMGEIYGERLEKAMDVIRTAIVAWNEHIRLKEGKPLRDDPSRGLSWGDPSRLPPDPPPHIQERLRRREREMNRPPKPHKTKPRRDG